MSPASELEVMKIIDDALCQVEDQATKDRILIWISSKYGTVKSTGPSPLLSKVAETKKTKKSKKQATPSLIKDLNLNPTGKKPFKTFIQEKGPSSQHEQLAVAVYYLIHELGLKVTLNHVYTCFKDAGWRIPPNLYDQLTRTASKKGWIDTSDMDNIVITARGENLVEHDLPHKLKE